MKSFNNLKIKIKLLICFLIVAIFTGTVGTIGIFNMSASNDRTDSIYHNNFLPSHKLALVERNLQLIRVNYFLMLYEEDMSTYKERVNQVNEWSKENDANLLEYEKLIINEEDRELFNALNGTLVGYKEIRAKAIALIGEGKYIEAKAITPEFAKKRSEVETAVEALISYNINLADRSIKSSESTYKAQSLMMIVIIVISVLLAISLGFVIANLISKPLKKLTSIADAISVGDVEVDVDINSKDEIGKLADSFKKMIKNIQEQTLVVERIADGDLTMSVAAKSEKDILGIKLNEMVEKNNEILSNISYASDQVASGSNQVSDSSMSLSEGATEQASAIEELSASIEQISSQTKQNAVNANEANGLALTAMKEAEEGNDKMQNMLHSMAEINDSSSNISKIIKVIDEIAFQTNILALNAAVEAARAGQHGKGFAVVAEEVRNLAARSANAAKETTVMIESSIKKVDDGTRLANDTASALSKIVLSVSKAAQLVGEIAVASDEQATGISQVNQGIMQISQVVQSNSATSEETAAASEELAGQAELLKQQILRFKLKKVSVGQSYKGYEEINPEILRMLEEMNSRKYAATTQQSESASGNPKKIVLSDHEFGKY
ncbi:MAG: methyl-accepting chemotaxis protein [Firmicutes bacterium HGW-Firmicutes-1]|jgi:methyl-accepting chemotaxis protein|nr:MAG: methyl-accepting chemotaxis protein [Firmicutes bacterium HGW-Firmicutes-1]